MSYCGRDGRLSRKTLENRVNGAATPNESFLWSNWTYDALGNVTTFAYPQCTHAACTAISPRTVQNSYTNGGLTQVGFPGSPGAYANSITYHPNGLVNQVVHANTSSIPSTWLTDTYGLDPKGMSRPASITTTASTGVQRWATGVYRRLRQPPGDRRLERPEHPLPTGSVPGGTCARKGRHRQGEREGEDEEGAAAPASERLAQGTVLSEAPSEGRPAAVVAVGAAP